jgi:hypothetical protein
MLIIKTCTRDFQAVGMKSASPHVTTSSSTKQKMLAILDPEPKFIVLLPELKSAVKWDYSQLRHGGLLTHAP